MGWLSDLWGTVHARLDRPATEAPPPGQPVSIDALVERMRGIDSGLPADDGVAAFNRMYLRVTELVRDRLREGWFTDPAFMTRLDLVFAGLYLDAVDAPTPPRAWAPLFELRRAPGRLGIQFAVAGLNAHVNHDLPVAVVRACRQLGRTPDSPGVADDFHRVTDLLDSVQQEVRRSFLDGIALEVDRRVAGPVADLVGGWSLARAREAAWTNAGVLWRLGGIEPLRSDFLATLSGSVGMAGRYLLTPVSEPA